MASPAIAHDATATQQLISGSYQCPHHDEATKQAIFGLVDRLHQNEEELATLLDQTGLLSEFESLAYSENLDLADTLKFIVGYRDEHDLLVDVRRVRQVFGDYPPVEWMTEEAVRAFTRLYGPPLQKPEPRPEEEDAVENEVAESESDHSGVSGEEGGVCPPKESRPDQGQAAELDAVPPMPAELEARMQEVARTLGGELVESEPPDDGSHALAAEAADREPPQPLHELTERGRFRIGDSMTLTLPEDTMVAGVGSRRQAAAHQR
ncbi:37S ribosomal protein S22 [Ascosphaera acerosa]|nr:37S ribosomal protein S22 [Ascosphaera acerosa]